MEKEDWSIWEALEKREMEIGDGESIWTSIKEKLDISKKKPERIEAFELKEFEHKGKKYYILKNLENNKFIRMSEADFFVWEKLDGESTIRDIALAYFLKFNSMGFANIGILMSSLAAGGFLKEKTVDALALLRRRFAEKEIKNRIQLAIYRLITFNVQMKNVDEKMKSSYRKFVWMFFTKPFVLLSLVLIVLGLLLFYIAIDAAPQEFSRLDLSTLAGAYVIIMCSIIIHELAHGFTTTHYKREVSGFGLMFYYGGIAAFCDTTDIWMAPRFARFAVSFAGPYSNFIIGSALGILSYLSIGGGLITSILIKASLMNYLLGILNLNPLLEWDGYYMLMDYFEMPNMRKRSFRFLREKFLHKLRGPEKLSSEEKILATYGIMAFVYTVTLVLFLPLKYFDTIKSFFSM